MIRYLLDTNVLSEAIKTSPNKHVMKKLEIHQGEIATASPVWHELWYGCERLPSSRKKKVIESFLADVIGSSLEIFPYDETAGKWHAEQRARLTNAGRPPSFVDGQIAAIAKTNNLILVTRNTPDFDVFPELKVQNWHV
jgi:tRNA(fMet)-specific endonuclease VapC